MEKVVVVRAICRRVFVCLCDRITTKCDASTQARESEDAAAAGSNRRLVRRRNRNRSQSAFRHSQLTAHCCAAVSLPPNPEPPLSTTRPIPTRTNAFASRTHTRTPRLYDLPNSSHQQTQRRRRRRQPVSKLTTRTHNDDDHGRDQRARSRKILTSSRAIAVESGSARSSGLLQEQRHAGSWTRVGG